MKKGSIEAMQAEEFTTDFINWALTYNLETFNFIVDFYPKKSMRPILDTMLRQLVGQFMSQKY